jgi:hypothetical protein
MLYSVVAHASSGNIKKAPQKRNRITFFIRHSPIKTTVKSEEFLLSGFGKPSDGI